MENPEPVLAQPERDDQPGEIHEIDSVTLARLLEEVRNDGPSEPHAYNRMHNRHNR